MLNETPRRSTIRLTRRGRVALLATGAVVAAAAVAVPLAVSGDDGRPTALTIPEGWRSGQVYDAVDKALALPAGTTKKTVPQAGLKLPGDAGGNPEGYLFPATYPLGAKSTPKSLLSYMVNTANKRFGGGQATTAGADRDTANPYQSVIIASIVEAEADNKEDMGKVARVIYNRLDHGMPLQMDSTLNYGLGRSTLDTTAKDTKLDNPYNTYVRMGLPPSPIGNPGEQALKAATAPTQGDWLYFVTVKPGDTRFTADYAEHQKNVAEFNKIQGQAKKDG
ncbi:endolytic transglycosylase MltG [Streptomyces sp. SID14478]|uniref:endolytic transglycosylase MltG n=1 Tax=Streptomyces sp. SID14478 TaxID=2706073 RepID=UPI0013E02DC1|nr:endolytic transglycosylase MltG [Streptomyces sp. SID14478]NEB82409.1 endolytic transglycosylase MltG [Streptomyces sp. SID14478]